MKFIIIIGPPAVGKMAVGLELSKITGFRLFHNHMTIDLILNFFDYGTPKFNKLTNEFRRRIFEEVASSDLPGLIFTYVTDMISEDEKAYLDKISSIFKNRFGSVFYIELESSLDERLKRNKTPLRIKMKPSKRNLDRSEQGLLEMEQKYTMNSSKKYPFFFNEGYLKIENTNLTANEVAIKIKNYFNF